MKNSALDTSPRSDDRVLFVPEIVAFGGGERVYLALLRYLHDKGIPHRLVSYYQSIDMSAYADWPLIVETIDPPRNPLLKAKSLKKRFGSQKGGVPPMLLGSQATMHAAAFGLKNYSVFILDTPSLLSEAAAKPKGLRKLLYKPLFAITEKLTQIGLKRANHVITNTNYLADEIETLYGLRSLISYPGAPGEPQNYQYRPPEKTALFRLVSVCRLEKTKRVDWILRSLSALQEEGFWKSNKIDWQFDVVGTGSHQEELEQLAVQLKIKDRVIFHGHVSDDELEDIYSAADLFLMPAVQGYGLPALEALTHKIPVLLHRESGVSEILQGNPWVEVIAGDERSLTDGLRNIVARAFSGKLKEYDLPSYPTEAQWAEEVCRLCDWIK